ncbi:SMI1/KNR4 family protein [Lacticaseibacillus porcinae]|uniref:SMI1/KNR4 family protein n=1 Tax=Lacticaseibacillus porcinae TaxID=1123687 RepID=UPI000F7ABD7B|nr:SMI1/KNR4 family protein [Lacticaseibacillus porcinae]
MIAWPLPSPEPAGLTISRTAPLPESYWQAVATGRWPHEYWLHTDEPTSDAIDGVAIHAIATPGPQVKLVGLPDSWWPIAQDGDQIFAVAADGAIYYRDLEVDQQLQVGNSWDDFAAKLQWRKPLLTAPFSPQVLAHALLVADANSLPPLFEILREQGNWSLYTQWLVALKPKFSEVVGEEINFARDFLPLSALQKHTLNTI